MGDDHDYVRSLLPEFVMSCWEASAQAAAWNALEAHLDSCAACREELAELLELLDETYAGTLPPDLAAVPERSSLPAWSGLHQPVHGIATVQVAATAFRRTLIEFSEALRDAMRQPALGGSYRSQALSPAEPEPEHKPDAGLDSADIPAEFRYELSQTCSEDLAVAIDFALKDAAQRLYEVKLTVSAPDRDPYSQAGHRVTLHYEAQTAEAITDASGCVAFPGIPYAMLPQLQITITPRPPDA